MDAALQDCNLVLLNGNSQTVFSTGTANQGTGPCRLAVSGAGGGGFAVLDSRNATLYLEGAYSPAGTLSGTLPADSVLKQVTPVVEVCLELPWTFLKVGGG